MTPVPVKLPSLNANDDQAELVKWMQPDGAAVRAGDVIALVETTKSVVEIEAPASGHCRQVAALGTRLATGAEVAWILASADTPLPASAEPAPAAAGQRPWTRKAELVAKKLGLDIQAIADKLGRQVNEADVVAYQSPPTDVVDLVDDPYPQRRRERVLLIGGGGGGGVLVIDAILRGTHQRAVGILDNNPALHGKTQLGVPILGGNALAGELWRDKRFDAAIVVVTANVQQRQAIFDELVAQGIPLTNVIDPSVVLRTNVQMGVGNLIMANGFLAACVSIGDNNFMASHVCIEHHSKVGSHCTLGPRTTTSGAVTIGDRVKFGMGVLVEPYLTIGSDALIPSGCVLTASVPANSVVKLASTQTVRER